jgi:hypothetical protein
VPKLIQVDLDRFTDHKRNLYDTDWNVIDVSYLYPKAENNVEPPENLTEILEIASMLASDFPFVRVDLYNIKGKIIFGEMTFYPESGTGLFKPLEYDNKLGNLFTLPKVTN